MIKIQDKKDCCGCSACVQVCPRKCITMEVDEEGFQYPYSNDYLCIDCHLCEKVCPVINQDQQRIPKKVYAAKNLDDNIRLESSSGGLFTIIASEIIKEGGVVFGAKFNNAWEVVHDYIDRIDDLHLLRGSKYVQSIIGDAYSRAEKFLNEGRTVLFSGTPCQIAGLKRFLRKKYINLLTVDVICHGVPSPRLWNEYLDHMLLKNKIRGLQKRDDISAITFRSKVTGWQCYSFQVQTKDGDIFTEIVDDNIYMQGFLNNLFLRPSCYSCPAKKGKSGSEYTLGDYWGVSAYHPEIYDDNGVSLLFAYGDESAERFVLSSCEIESFN